MPSVQTPGEKLQCGVRFSHDQFIGLLSKCPYRVIKTLKHLEACFIGDYMVHKSIFTNAFFQNH